MHYSVLRLRDVRMAVVLVEKGQLYNDELIANLQVRLTLPVMLVARDDGSWQGVKARAQFETAPHLAALLALDDLEWTELSKLPAPAGPELPF